MLYTFGTGDSNAITCETIFLRPEEATRTKQPFTCTCCISSFSTNVKFDNSGGQSPIHNPLASEAFYYFAKDIYKCHRHSLNDYSIQGLLFL